MRMPPVDLRSPSSLRSATRMRSCSILMGSFPGASATPITVPRPTCRGPPRACEGWGAGGSSRPAELVQTGLVDAEVVRDLVHDGDRDLLDDVVDGVADVAD